MRLAFFVLLLANLLLFAWTQGYLATTESGREPERLARQLVPEQLRIVPPAVAATPPAAPPLACKRLEGLSADEAKSLVDAVQVHGGWQTRILPLALPPQHWVVITDLATRAVAEKKQGELRQFGVKDSEIVEDNGSFAVSLGLFRDAQRADSFLQGLTAKGIRSARIQPRPAADSFAVELRANPADLASTLPGLHAALPRVNLLDCAAP